MKFKAVAASIASAALCFSLVGCGGESQEASSTVQVETVSIDAEPVSITQSGFSVTSDDEVNYVFSMSNPNDGYIADRVTFSITGFDSDGNMVLGAAESVERMFPGIEYAVAGSTILSDASGLERIEINPSMDNVGWIPTDISPNEAADMFSIVNPRTGRIADDSVSVNGRVVANDAALIASAEGVSEDVISANVCAVLLDSDGNYLIGGTYNGLVFDEEEGTVHPSEVKGDTASANEQAEEASAEGEVLKAAPFSISIVNAPGFKECRYFIMPV